MLEKSNFVFMKHIVTDDETWAYEFDLQTTQQASEWRLVTKAKIKNTRQSRLKVKAC